MKTEWVTIRPNGKPIEPGTFCRVLDMEDGTNPIYYYGKSEEEVNDKIALNNMHAQRALARRAEAPPQVTSIAPRKRLSTDEVMQATTDLQNPAKAAEAVTRLVEDQTGRNFKQEAMDSFKQRADEWTRETTDFYNCKPNRALLATRLGVIVNGDVSLITKEMMTQTFHEMLDAGDLVPGTSEPATPLTNVTAFPDETQVQRVETIPVGRAGSGTRSTSFRAPQSVQTRTLKYTREQIDRMSMAKTEALIRSGDKDYAEACEFYYPSAKAMA